MRASYVSLIVLGFVMGAAAILLADSGTDSSATRVAPVAATGGTTGDAGHHASTGVSLTGNTACEAAGAPISEGQTSGTHGHRGPSGWTTIDRATRDAMTTQLAVAHQVTVDYPTVAAAEAAGYRMTTTYVPCIGAHYLNAGHIGGFDPAHPAMLLYDGVAPESKIVGLSYAALSGKKAPEGFAGPNDVWHQHNLNGGLCMKGGVVVGAESTSKEECAARGGTKIQLDSLWMNHVWVADGWPSSWGVFSSEHPDLGGQIGAVDAAPDPAKTAKASVGG